MSRISKFGLTSVLALLFLTLIGRLLFPFGDEPDWFVRAPRVLFGEHPFWSPYYIFESWLNTFSIDSGICNVEAGPISLWAYIPYGCTENFEQALARWMLTIFILTPMLLIIVFRKGFIRFMSVLQLRLSFDEWNHRIDALALSLLFPGMLFYLGVLAEEQLYLIVALYIFLFWGFKILISGLLILLFSIDLGNWLVTIFFVSTLWFFTYLRILSRTAYFLSIVILATLAYFVGFKFLEVLLNFSFITGDLAQKSEAMISALDGSDLLTKYPVFFRPIITFMSFVFMTPSGVKIPLLYVPFSLYFIWITLNVIKKRDNKVDVFWFTPIAIIIFFVFLFPTYGNAKYYIFMLPFLIYASLFFINKKNIFLFIIGVNAFVFFHLFLYGF